MTRSHKYTELSNVSAFRVAYDSENILPLDDYGLKDEDLPLKKCIAEKTHESIEYTFSNPTEGRFSDRKNPTLYCAESLDVARAEKAYWVSSSWLLKKASTQKYSAIEFEIYISGKYSDLTSSSQCDLRLVCSKEKSYEFCRKLSRSQRQNGSQILKTYSARRINAVNYPVLSRAAVTKLHPSRSVKIELKNKDLFAVTASKKTKIAIEDTYAHFKNNGKK